VDHQPLARSASSLLTLSTRLQNTGMLWDGINTVHNAWGNPPTQMYPVTASIRLHMQADSIHVLPLRADGVPLGGYASYVAADTNLFAVSIDQNQDLTTWFGIQAYGKGSVSGAPEESARFPAAYSLEQNYPNPFNPSTAIAFTVPGGSRQVISLRVFDLLGREIAVLFQGEKEPGAYAVGFNAAALPSGVYFYRLTAGSYTAARKMLLTR
jgi:Secretion system C-terminal sorting domain